MSILMNGEKKLLYEAPLTHEGGRHPNGGELRATMTKQPRERRKKPTGEITAQYSALSRAEFARILEIMDVPKQRFARHSGRNQRTVTDWTNEEKADEGPLPRWIEWVLMMYHIQPWTRRLRGRMRLPLKSWGITRDDTDKEAEDEDDVVTKSALTERRGHTLPAERTIRRLVATLLAIHSAAPESGKEIAGSTLRSLNVIDDEGNELRPLGGHPRAQPDGGEEEADDLPSCL